MRYSLSFDYYTDVVVKSLKEFIVTDAFYVVDDYFNGVIDLSQVSHVYWLKATEMSKTLETVEQIISQIHALNLNRDSNIIAIGGGITLDIAAFVASIYKRGCRLVLIPSTIIGMIDASIGGKTGVNYQGIKNVIGTFYPANEVIVDFDLLKTLSDLEVKNGCAELIKTLILFDRQQLLIKQTCEVSNEYILSCIEYKMNICSADLHDKGIRQSLNFGHTLAHLFETITNNRISHGTAVALGMQVEILYSLEVGLLRKEDALALLGIIKYHCNTYNFSTEEINRIKRDGANILLKDKKNTVKDSVKLVLLNDTAFEMVLCDAKDIITLTENLSFM
jgi:3-dehydroquinate synthase